MNNCKHLTVHELRRAGYRVKIRHTRSFNGVRRIDDDSYMTRGEYENARLNGELEYDFLGELFYSEQGVADGKMPAYGKAVDSCGGWTQIEITTPSNEQLKGRYNFKHDEPFCRRKGIMASVGRAMLMGVRSNRKGSKQGKVAV